jgi:hypothetical protein
MDKKSVFFKKEYQIKNLQRAGTKVPPPSPPQIFWFKSDRPKKEGIVG